MSRRVTPAHRAEFAAYRAVAGIAARVGEPAALSVGAVIGGFVYRPLGIRRQVAEDNLRRAFPERDEAWVRRTALAAYRHLGREAVAMLRLPRLDRAEILRRVAIPPAQLQALARAAARGRGVVIATGHFGSWEMAGATLAALGHRVTAIVKRIGNPLLDREIRATREAVGMRLIDRWDGSHAGLDALARGDVLAVVADQDARRRGIFVPFFGRPASTYRGAALMALRAGAPLFLGYARRGPDGYIGSVEEVDASRDGPADVVVHRLTAAFTARLEAAIREAPDQYFWQHRRWKTAPPEEPRDVAAV